MIKFEEDYLMNLNFEVDLYYYCVYLVEIQLKNL